MSANPATLPITTRQDLSARVAVPGSKSITNRALLIAGLAKGESRLEGALESDDTVVMRTALRQLGASIEIDSDTHWTIQGTDGQLATPEEPLWLQNSGTAIRFLVAAATLAPGPTVLDGNARMRERLIAPLADALSALGAPVEIQGEKGCPPVVTAGGGLPGGSVEIDASQSSQYVTAILLAAPYASRETEIRFKNGLLVSRPYIDTTVEVMTDFGAEVSWDPDLDCPLRVPAGQTYKGREYSVEPDASAAAYPFCAAAIAGGTVDVEGLNRESKQADLAILNYLERMGCAVESGANHIRVRGPEKPLRGLGSVDLNDLPDAAMALAVVAAFADSPSRLENIANLRIKETDRLAALESELRRLGCNATAGPDFLAIEPAGLHGAEIETYDDHRMAMSFALAGLRVPGVAIRDPGCVSKTWPGYFDTLESL